MGTLVYGKAQKFEFDDRTLEHVRAVVVARLRKKESFFLTWTPHDSGGGDSVSLWVSPETPLGFQFSSTEREALSREWVDALMKHSYGNRGLVIFPERVVRSH